MELLRAAVISVVCWMVVTKQDLDGFNTVFFSSWRLRSNHQNMFDITHQVSHPVFTLRLKNVADRLSLNVRGWQTSIF